MKTRDQIYDNEARSLLRDLSMYRCLTKEQIFRLYPKKQKVLDNLLTYLEYHSRVWRDGDRYYADETGREQPDRCLSAAIWLLADMIEDVEFHSISDFPAQIIFFAYHEVYEIIYVQSGRETLISHLLASAREQDSNYLLIVENLDQIDMVDAPNIRGYCTVSDSGEVQYYQRE